MIGYKVYIQRLTPKINGNKWIFNHWGVKLGVKLFIQVALKLRLKIFGQKIMDNFNQDKKNGTLSEHFNIWNSAYANSLHQDKRVKYEGLLINYIQMDFVNSKEEIYQAIEKLI